MNIEIKKADRQRKEEIKMNILTMRKNKGTIEVKTDRRLYVIDFLNDKILSNGKEIKKLPSDVIQFYFTCRQHPKSYDKETDLLSFLVHVNENSFEDYRKTESFVSIAIQNLDLNYCVNLDAMCNLKLTKDYLNWCREYDEPVCLETERKYRQEKLNRVYRSDDDIEKEELKELINTITSKTLAGEIDQATGVNLLSDLMATSLLDKVERQKEEVDEEKEETNKEDKEESELELSQAILNKEQIEQVNRLDQEIIEEDTDEPKELKDADSDFYTRSMDLSNKDFELSDDFKEKTLPLPVKIILVLLVLVCLAAAAYFIWQTYFK